MPASIPVAIRLTDKSEEVSVKRFGKTLVLVENRTERVIEKLDLTANTFAEAHRTVLTDQQYATTDARNGEFASK